MVTTFHRMRPRSENMATEPLGRHGWLVLCVECGWESEVNVPSAPWVVFKDHACRLTHTTEGAGW